MRQDRGFILAATLVLLLIAGAVLGGAFFYALQEERIARNELAAARALAAAEAGAGRVLAGWDRAREGAVLPGDSLVLAPALAPGEGSATVVLTPQGETTVLLRSRGEDPTRLARRDVAVLVRLAAPPVLVPAALTAVAAVDPAIGAAVDGAEHVPAGWRCEESASAPPVAAPWAGSWSDWDSLALLATRGPLLPDARNPAVLVDGDFSMNGGSAIGILMVTGDVRIDGGAMLTGLLLVRGHLQFAGAGGSVLGAVRAGSIGADAGAISGLPLISWSGCAVGRARRALAVARAVTGWWWGDLAGGW